jgi:maleate isomerase
MQSLFTTSDTPPALAADSLIRLGAIVLATDLTLERDLASLLPDHVALHVARIDFNNPTTPKNLRAMAPDLSQAASLLVPGVRLAAVGFGCTSGAVVIGDARITRAIGAVRPGVPVTTPAMATLAALAELGAQRLAILTPYLAQTTAPVLDYFQNAGLQVMRAHGLGLEDDRDIACIAPDAIRQAVAQADHPQAEALFISCTAMPVLRMIPDLEAMLGKPVLSSNQVLGWHMLRLAGQLAQGPGRLFVPHEVTE